MKRVDRRTFLVNSMRTGAVVVAAGSVGYYEWERHSSPPLPRPRSCREHR